MMFLAHGWLPKSIAALIKLSTKARRLGQSPLLQLEITQGVEIISTKQRSNNLDAPTPSISRSLSASQNTTQAKITSF